MFCGSEIAKRFQLSKTKFSNGICHGLPPYVKDLLLSNDKDTYVVVSSDESYNITVKKGYMDVLVYFGNAEQCKVDTRYLTSKSMERAAATDVLGKFESASSSLQKEKIIQVSSDRPNVNLKLLEMLDEKRKDSIVI